MCWSSGSFQVTPAPPRGFFDVFCKGVEASNARGETFFTLVNHSLSCKACQEAGDGARCSMFIRSVRQHPWIVEYPDAPIVPIVECNNNEVFAASLVSVFKHYPPMWNPFTKDRFPRGVTDGVVSPRMRVVSTDMADAGAHHTITAYRARVTTPPHRKTKLTASSISVFVVDEGSHLLERGIGT